MIFIGVGSSIGKAQSLFAQAEDFLVQNQVQVIRKSANLKNPPLGGVAQNEFTNAVWHVGFSENTWEKINWVLLPQKRRQYLKAKKLLKILQQCEKKLGRVREKRWDDRTLDLDILMFHDLVLSKRRLNLPHPEIPNRSFVLLPWRELVDKNFEIPKFGKLVELIKDLPN